MKGNAAKALLKNHPWLAKFFRQVSGNGQDLTKWLRREVSNVKVAPSNVSTAAMRPSVERWRNWEEKTFFHLLYHVDGEHTHERIRVLSDPAICVEDMKQLMLNSGGEVTIDAVVKRTIQTTGSGKRSEFTIYKP